MRYAEVLAVGRVPHSNERSPDLPRLAWRNDRLSATSFPYPLSESKPQTTVRGQLVFFRRAQASSRSKNNFAHDLSNRRALASKPRRAHSFPSLPDYERHESQSSYWIGP